jgi:hypothetical protein
MGKLVNGSPLPGPPLPVDIGGMLYDMNKMFNPLHHECLLDYHVSAVQDGYVYLSIAMPEGLTRAFITMLESLTGFFRVMDTKARSIKAQGKAHDPAERQRIEEAQATFSEKVCSLFDTFTAQGVEAKEAIRLTNSALKEESHPWATYEAVSSELRKAGRFRRQASR